MKEKDALAKIRLLKFKLFLLEIGLPATRGTELLKKIREKDQDTILIMMPAYPKLDSFIDSVKYRADRDLA